MRKKRSVKKRPWARRVKRLVEPIQAFIQKETSGGVILLLSAGAALSLANSPWSQLYQRVWHEPLTIGWGKFSLTEPLSFWINDGLMSFFFFVVGLEIKRELWVGELSSLSLAVLPIMGALGGMVVPAGIYAIFNHGAAGAAGWGIPIATDIAFSLGVLTVLGKRVPFSLRVFLVALAIADDIGAILVIALWYTGRVSWMGITAAIVLFSLAAALSRSGPRSQAVYALLGAGIWLALLKSGVEPTIAGVMLAMTIPVRSDLLDDASNPSSLAGAPRPSPAALLEEALHPWVAFGVMPIFALSNAAVGFSKIALLSALYHPVSLGIALGLILGKPLGISVFAWLAVRSGLAKLPSRVSWRQLFAAACLGGIGFTMSLFVAHLAFGSEGLLSVAKIGILGGSLVSAVAGGVLLNRASRSR